MYFDTKPCQVCGAEVEIRPHSADEGDAKVGDPDGSPDERVCTNSSCATHDDREDAPTP